ncbi:AAEL017259-PA, partial [Aedes aegypti]
MKINAKYVCALLALFSVKHISCDSLPCDFIDSINITDGMRDVLGNIVHNNILYKPKYYRTIDYDYEDFSTKKFVNEYIRGCPCAVRLCVRMCCPQGTVMYDYQCLPTVNKLEVLVNTTLFNVQRNFEVVDLTENSMYGFLYGKPCESVYELNRADDIWSFARVSEKVVSSGISKRVSELHVICRLFVFFFSIPAGMLLSVPFLLVTFFVYACIPELRNMHGKSLMCYVLGLAAGYTVLSLVQMGLFEGSSLHCKVSGYLVYFWFMVSFFWLNVMSFDIYWTFR